MPTLSGITTWIKKEGLNAVWIIITFFAIKYLWKQEWSKGLVLLAAAGVAALVINNPSLVVTAFEAVAKKLTPGG
jgi:hypothetical protein